VPCWMRASPALPGFTIYVKRVPCNFCNKNGSTDGKNLTSLEISGYVLGCWAGDDESQLSSFDAVSEYASLKPQCDLALET